MSFIVADSNEKASKQVEFVPDPTALSRELQVSTQQVREIASRNPWAAAALLGMQELGSLAELRSGVTIMTTTPTTEALDAMLHGDFSLSRSMATPDGIQARVSHRLERGPGSMARLHLSSYTVDEDDRMQFKTYPDIVISLVEMGSAVDRNAPASREEALETQARPLVAQSWSVD